MIWGVTGTAMLAACAAPPAGEAAKPCKDVHEISTTGFEVPTGTVLLALALVVFFVSFWLLVMRRPRHE